MWHCAQATFVRAGKPDQIDHHLVVAQPVDGLDDGWVLRAGDEHLAVRENLLDVAGQQITDVREVLLDEGPVGAHQHRQRHV